MEKLVVELLAYVAERPKNITFKRGKIWIAREAKVPKLTFSVTFLLSSQ